jgi:hypothetical protein
LSSGAYADKGDGKPEEGDRRRIGNGTTAWLRYKQVHNGRKEKEVGTIRGRFRNTITLSSSFSPHPFALPVILRVAWARLLRSPVSFYQGNIFTPNEYRQ